MNLTFKVFFFGLLACTIFSCSENYEVRQKRILEKEGWSYEDKLSFSFEVSDTNQLYDLFLNIEHQVNFPRQNIYVNIFTGKQGSTLKKKLSSLELSDNMGRWKGHCNDETCNYLVPLQTNTFFNEAAKYIFEIEQFTRLNPLPAVKSIEFLAKKSAKKE